MQAHFDLETCKQIAYLLTRHGYHQRVQAWKGDHPRTVTASAVAFQLLDTLVGLNWEDTPAKTGPPGDGGKHRALLILDILQRPCPLLTTSC